MLDLAVKDVSGLACSLACPTSTCTSDAKIDISSTKMSCCVSTINSINFSVLDLRVNTGRKWREYTCMHQMASMATLVRVSTLLLGDA